MVEALLKRYPKAIECIAGHSEPVITIEQMPDDDRSYDMKVYRCSHCNMILKEEYL